MAGISLDLYKRLKTALLNSDVFDNANKLNSLFMHEAISPWCDNLPSANTSQDRADSLIDFLIRKEDNEGRNALGLFLYVLSEQIHPGDSRKQTLRKLADEIDTSKLTYEDAEQSRLHSRRQAAVSFCSGQSTVEIKIAGDPATFTDDQKNNLLMMFAINLGISLEALNVLSIKSGSVILRIEMPQDAAERLKVLYENNASIIEELNIQRVEIIFNNPNQSHENMRDKPPTSAVIQQKQPSSQLSVHTQRTVKFKGGNVEPNTSTQKSKSYNQKSVRDFVESILKILVLVIVVMAIITFIMILPHDVSLALIVIGAITLIVVVTIFLFGGYRASSLSKPSMRSGMPSPRKPNLSKNPARGAAIEHRKPPPRRTKPSPKEQDNNRAA